jgi:hypothetical protein
MKASFFLASDLTDYLLILLIPFLSTASQVKVQVQVPSLALSLSSSNEKSKDKIER